MIQIKPVIQQASNCPYCSAPLRATGILWQGVHICLKSECDSCHASITEDLKVGHAIHYPYQINLKNKQLFGKPEARKWLGEALLNALLNPIEQEVKVSREVFINCEKIILLNCLDDYYGHCLLKLLNAQRHLKNDSAYGLVVLIPESLRWLVPKGVAEIWAVNSPLKSYRFYYPNLDQFIHTQLERFKEVYVSEAYSHPGAFDIEFFTGIPKFDFNRKGFQITFVWREDRVWFNEILSKIFRKLGVLRIDLLIQNWRVRKLFKQLKTTLPAETTRFVVAGLGKNTCFPKWIQDLRVDRFDEQTEREICQVYASSSLVIGVHGSNMLLPSAHAGMTIDLMPHDRWGNFAQDILYQESNPRVAAFRYRFLPLRTPVYELALIASEMLLNQGIFYLQMTVA